jgi:hypothetical protein
MIMMDKVEEEAYTTLGGAVGGVSAAKSAGRAPTAMRMAKTAGVL